VFPADACAKVNVANALSNSYCASESENKRITEGKGYGVWSLALSLRLTFPPT
jgi:predicted alternative tryptophan synthase beta-subunit